MTAKHLSLLTRLAGGALIAGALVSCGNDGPRGADAPRDASVTDFCTTIGGLTTADPEEMVDELAEVGTPEGIPDEARDGFEVMIDEATADEISDTDQDKVDALSAYLAEVCAGIPAG